MNAPAARFSPVFPAQPLAAEVPAALDLAAQIREIWPEVEGWVNFPLFNESGQPDDLRLSLYPGPARATPQAQRLPAAAGAVRQLIEAGFAVKQARIAVLAPRTLLRCHVDMYSAHRLILPLNHQGQDFRHVFGPICVAMHTGELWGVAGQTCHGAAHLGRVGQRVVLLVDADPSAGQAPDWFHAPWQIPAERRVERPALTEEKCKEINALTDAEPAWLRAPFEYDLTAEEAYAQLVVWWAQRDEARAQYWQQHACVCVPQ